MEYLNDKVKKKWLPLLMSATAVLGVLIGWINGRNSATNEIEKRLGTGAVYGRGSTMSKTQAIIDMVRSSYVDPINVDSVEEKVIPDILRHLDPHSVYIPAKDLEFVSSELKSNFGGIGVTFSILEDTVNILSVVSGGPSSALGVMPGDKIIKVNGYDFAGKHLTNKMVMDSLRGEIDTKVQITVLRHGKTSIDFDIIRGEIPLTSVNAAYCIADGVGYIKIDRFAEKTYYEMQTGIAKLKMLGCGKLIIDFRSNGGGYLNVVQEMCNEFLERGDLIVYTEGSHQSRHNTYATGSGLSRNMELVVLIDEFSASASEIFAGAVQDNDRGTIIGRRSFGKGLVQTEYSLPDGSGLRLTIARYHTPSGRCIQRPYNNGTDEYYNDVNERYKSGELFVADSIHADSTQVFYTRKGRVVYGGGGITPDIFIPYDTARASNYLYQLRAKRQIYSFAIHYTEMHGKELKSLTPDDLIKRLLKQSFINELTAFAASHGVKRTSPIDKKEREVIENETRAYIGQLIYDNDAFYPILNTMDPAIEAALKVWNAKSLY